MLESKHLKVLKHNSYVIQPAAFKARDIQNCINTFVLLNLSDFFLLIILPNYVNDAKEQNKITGN